MTKIRLPHTQYSQEFREQSVMFLKESGLSLAETEKMRFFIQETKIGSMLTDGMKQASVYVVKSNWTKRWTNKEMV